MRSNARTTALLPSLALLGVTGACTLPERARPEQYLVQAPAEWFARSPTQSSADVGVNWWRRIDSRELDAVIQQVLAQNLDLRAAQGRLGAAAAQANIAGADLYPRLDLSASATRQRQVFVGLPIPGAASPLTRTYNSFGVSLNTSWELDLWGRLGAGRNAAQASYVATLHDLQALRQSLAAQTAKVFFAITEAREQVILAQKSVASFALTEQQVRDRFERGLRPALDLRRAQTNRASATATLRLREEQLARATRQLDSLMSRYPRGECMADASLPAADLTMPIGQPASLLQRRPDVVAAEQRLVATGFQLQAAKAALYPSISLTGSGGTASDELKNLLDSDFLVWNVAGRLLQPIFDAGRLANQVRLATENERVALASYANAALRAYVEVESALATQTYLDAQAQSLREATAAATAAQTLAEERYRAGLVTFLEVSEAQRLAIDLQSRLLAVRRLRLDLFVDLHLALGAPVQQETSNETQP